jgi:PPOX class probable F420-dependent enzyme
MTETSYRMSREQVDAFLAAPRHAIIAAGPAGGGSQLSPVWYGFEESRLYFSTLVRSAKCRHLRQDPRIAICVDGAHPDTRFVSIYGTAEIVRRYHDSDDAARRFQAEVAEDGASALVVVSPERIVGWDYN